jgi:hypothetical protein
MGGVRTNAEDITARLRAALRPFEEQHSTPEVRAAITGAVLAVLTELLPKPEVTVTAQGDTLTAHLMVPAWWILDRLDDEEFWAMVNQEDKDTS